MSLHCSTHKVFKSHVKYSANFPWLSSTENSHCHCHISVTPFVFEISPLHGPHGKHRLPLLGMHVCRCVPWQQIFLYIYPCFARRGQHRKHSLPSIAAAIRVYRAVAWQRVDQIRYSTLHMFVTYEYFQFT
jgi:hypothetical protein